MGCLGRRSGGVASGAGVLALLRVVQAASAAAVAPGLASDHRLGVEERAALIRQELQVGTFDGFLDDSGFATERDDVAENDDVAAKVPVCGLKIVSYTCAVLRQGDAKSLPEFAVSLRQLTLALGLCTSTAQAESVIAALGLEEQLEEHPSGKREDMSIGCFDLCTAAVRYFKTKPAYWLVPDVSDMTCYKNDIPGLKCDVDISPKRVSTEMSKNKNFGTAGDHMVKGGQSSDGGGPQGVDHDCPFAGLFAVLRIAQLFRFYPRRFNNDFIDRSQLSTADQAKVYRALAKAEAWVSLTLRAMLQSKEVAERKEFFGGAGELTVQQVRDTVWRVLAFVLGEFMNGFHIVSPGPNCAGKMNAYAEQQHRGTGDVLDPNLLMGFDGRYTIYLCPMAWNQPDPDFVSIFMHEAVHHAGPIDVEGGTGNKNTKILNQAGQLRNAENYQRYFLRVVTEDNKLWRKLKLLWEKIGERAKSRRAKRKAKRNVKKAKKKAKKANK